MAEAFAVQIALPKRSTHAKTKRFQNGTGRQYRSAHRLRLVFLWQFMATLSHQVWGTRASVK